MPYVISYIAAGILLAVAAALHAQISPLKLLVRSVVIVTFWPLLVLAAPDFFVRQRDTEDFTSREEPDPVSQDLHSVSDAELAVLSNEERGRLERVKRAGERGTIFFTDATNFSDVLHRFWEDTIPPEAYRLVNAAKRKLEDDYEFDSGIRFSLREPDWYIGFSTEFVKSIAKLDKNKRARLLEALGKLAEAPTTPYGDTVKPLTGDMAGLWRYRMGGDRLVYKPNVQSKKVVLVSFGARGEIYG